MPMSMSPSYSKWRRSFIRYSRGEAMPRPYPATPRAAHNLQAMPRQRFLETTHLLQQPDNKTLAHVVRVLAPPGPIAT